MNASSTTKAYYDQYWSLQGFRPTGRTTIPIGRLLEENTSSTSSCLDVGCGDGRTAGLWLKERTASYIGVDVSEEAIEEAHKIGLDARVIADATSLPFPDRAFSVVLCLEVLEHLFAPQLAVAEMHRVLEPGGVLIATVPNVVYWRRRLDFLLLGRWNPLGDDHSTKEPWRDPHIRFFTRSSFRRMLLRAGFDAVSVGGHGGTILGDIPYLRRLCRRHGGWVTLDWRSNPAYAQFEKNLPSLLGYRLHAVARRPP